MKHTNSLSREMITPFERLVEYKVSPKSNFRCLELSPNGCMYAAITVDSIQIWSAKNNIMCLGRIRQNRPSGYSKALLNRLVIVWNKESDKIVVVRSEGIADFYKIVYNEIRNDLLFDDQDIYGNAVSASIEAICSINIEQYGYPQSACTYLNRIVIATDNGNISELSWNGDLVGCSIQKFISSSIADSTGQTLQGRRVLSVSSNSDLSILVMALDDCSCLLLDMADSHSYLPSHTYRLPRHSQEMARQVLCCPGLPYIAVTSSRLAVEIFKVVRDMTSRELLVTLVSAIDIRQYPQLSTSPLYAYDTIVSLCWCPGKPVIALGLKYQGITVWNLQGNMLFSYNGGGNTLIGSSETVPDSESPSEYADDSHLALGLEVSCCCFNMTGCMLLFNIPYEKVIHDSGNSVFYRESRLLSQRFAISNDCIISLETSSFFGYTDNELIHISSSCLASEVITSSLFSLPLIFISSGDMIMGYETSRSGRSCLIFTQSSLCIYQSYRGKWIVAMNIVQKALITAAAWISDYVFIIAVSPLVSVKPRSTIYAFNIHSISLDQAIQVVDLNFAPMGTPFLPTAEGLLACNRSCSNFVHICYVHCTETTICCGTNHGVFYLFSLLNLSECLKPTAATLSLSFRYKGDFGSSHVASSYLHVSGCHSVIVNDEEVTAVYENVMMWTCDGEFFLLDIANKTKPLCLHKQLFQIILCDHRDCPTVRTTIVLPDYLLLVAASNQIAWFPSLENTPSSVLTSDMTHSTFVSQQASGGIWGYIWSTGATVRMQRSGDEQNASGERNWLQPVITCSFHLLLAELLYSRMYNVASAILRVGASRHIPDYAVSLEFLLHYALNSGNSSFLSSTLQLLAELPLFPRLLVRCLRKQERSMWPYAVQSASGITHLFRDFLFSNDMEYAVTTISILQGLQCTVSAVWRKEMDGIDGMEMGECDEISVETWCERLDISEMRWLVEMWAELFTSIPAGECIAHVSGLQLLLISVARERAPLLPDIFRFLVMEEVRHADVDRSIPENFCAVQVLSKTALRMLERGDIMQLLVLLREIEFDWSVKEEEDAKIDNFATSLAFLSSRCRWVMGLHQCTTDSGEEECVLISEPIVCDDAMNEEDMDYLLHRLMMAGCAQWSLVLMLLLLKTKFLVNFALARYDVWERCIEDFSEEKGNIYSLLQSVQQMVDDRREQLSDESE